MPLNSSGAISLGGSVVGQSVNLELGKSATALVSMNDSNLRSLFGVGSGQISMSQGYGKSSWSNAGTRAIFAGGRPVPANSGQYGEVDGFCYATESIFNPAINLAQGRANMMVSNDFNRGYFGGGCSTPAVNNTYLGWCFATDGCTDYGTSIGTSNNACAGRAFHSSVKGHMGSNILDFPSLTTTASTVALAQARICTAPLHSSTRGYQAGGQNSNSTAMYNEIDGVEFSTETAINPAASLVQARANMFNNGLNSATRGYWGGGRLAPAPTGGLQQYTQIDGIIFSTETSIDPAAGLAQARDHMASASSSTRGYFAGGYYYASNSYWVNQIDGIDFTTDTGINPAAGLAQSRSSASGVTNSNA